jgi:hypothetical protein
MYHIQLRLEVYSFGRIHPLFFLIGNDCYRSSYSLCICISIFLFYSSSLFFFFFFFFSNKEIPCLACSLLDLSASINKKFIIKHLIIFYQSLNYSKWYLRIFLSLSRLLPLFNLLFKVSILSIFCTSFILFVTSSSFIPATISSSYQVLLLLYFLT